MMDTIAMKPLKTVEPESPPPAKQRVETPDQITLGGKLIYALASFPMRTGGSALPRLANPVFNILLGVNPLLIGSFLGIIRFVDAFTDPVMGYLSDNTRSRWGRRKPYILVGAIISGLLFPLIFWLPADGSENYYFIHLCIFGTLFYLGQTVMGVPYGALGFEMTSKYHERTRLFAWREAVGDVSDTLSHWYFLFIQLAIWGSVYVGMKVFGVTVGALFLALGIIPVFYFREHALTRYQRTKRIGFLTAAKITFLNKPYMLLVVAMLVMGLSSQLVNHLGVYLKVYYVFEGDPVAGASLAAVAGTAYTISSLAAIPVASWLSAHMGKKEALFALLGFSTLGAIAKWWAYDPNHFWIIPIVAAIIAPGSSAASVLVTSMKADVCDYDELNTGLRREGMYATFNAWIAKTVSSLAAVVSGGILVMTGFDASLEGNQAPETIQWMRILFVAVPVVGFFIAMYLIWRYPLTQQSIEEIQDELEKRKADQPQTQD